MRHGVNGGEGGRGGGESILCEADVGSKKGVIEEGKEKKNIRRHEDASGKKRGGGQKHRAKTRGEEE